MILAAALFLQSLMSFAIFAPLVMAPAIIETLGVAESWVGLYAPFAYGFAIFGSIASGTLLTYVGPWRLSFACLAVAALGIATFALSTPWAIAAGAMVIGLSYGPMTAAGSSILTQDTSRNLGLRMSIRQAGVPLGSSMAGFVAPALIGAYGWPTACLLMSVFGAATAIVFSLAFAHARREEALEKARRQDFRPLRLIFSNAGLRSLVFILVFFSSLQNCLGSFLSVYLVHQIGTDLVTAGFMVGLSNAIGMFARVVWGACADRIGGRFMLGLLGCVMSLASVLTGLLQPGTPTLAIAAVVAVFGATATGWNGIVMAQAARLAPVGLVGSVAGEIAVLAYVGFIIGPPLFSGISATMSIASAFLIFGGLCVVATALFLWTGRDARAD